MHERDREDGESSELEYAVEAVMGYRFEKGKAQLLVKWEGDTMRKATWEPLSSFNGACVRRSRQLEPRAMRAPEAAEC